MTIQIQQNRQFFLDALRFGNYKKGYIKSDAKGYPIIESPEDNDGHCACAIMIELFPKDGKFNFKHAQMSLGIKGSDCRYIQTELNDTPLTFPEIADIIEKQVFRLSKHTKLHYKGNKKNKHGDVNFIPRKNA